MTNDIAAPTWIQDLLGGLPPVVGSRRAEAVLGITRPTLHNLIESGQLAAFRTGPHRGHYRISVASIASFLARHAVQAGGR